MYRPAGLIFQIGFQGAHISFEDPSQFLSSFSGTFTSTTQASKTRVWCTCRRTWMQSPQSSWIRTHSLMTGPLPCEVSTLSVVFYYWFYYSFNCSVVLFGHLLYFCFSGYDTRCSSNCNWITLYIYSMHFNVIPTFYCNAFAECNKTVARIVSWYGDDSILSLLWFMSRNSLLFIASMLAAK